MIYSNLRLPTNCVQTKKNFQNKHYFFLSFTLFYLCLSLCLFCIFISLSSLSFFSFLPFFLPSSLLTQLKSIGCVELFLPIFLLLISSSLSDFLTFVFFFFSHIQNGMVHYVSEVMTGYRIWIDASTSYSINWF